MTQTNSVIVISEEEFNSRYPLRLNHLDPNACWSYGDGGYLFETYGEEIDFVRQQDPATIWTVVEGGDDGECILSGFHCVNGLGYLVSTVPVPEDLSIEVRLDD